MLLSIYKAFLISNIAYIQYVNSSRGFGVYIQKEIITKFTINLIIILKYYIDIIYLSTKIDLQIYIDLKSTYYFKNK